MGGRALHPTDRDRLLMPDGSVIMADAVIAEVATPPVPVEPGAPAAVEGYAARTRERLIRSLEGLECSGESTHVNVSMDVSVNDQVAYAYAHRFAAAAMLMIDREKSPGLLVRPRPGRLEVCGEYLTGDPLRAVLVFTAATAMAAEAAVRERRRLPPPLDLDIEMGRRRYGYYVDRRAFGADLYEGGRQAVLRLATGATVAAGRYLEWAWEAGRPHAERCFDSSEIGRVDGVVAGRRLLPLEGADQRDSESGTPEAHPLADALSSIVRPVASVEVEVATWSWVAFRLTGRGQTVVAVVPLEDLASFVSGVADGGFDSRIDEWLGQAPDWPVLRAVEQTTEFGVFASIEASNALLPVDRYGTGPGPAINVAKRSFVGVSADPKTPVPFELAFNDVALYAEHKANGSEPDYGEAFALLGPERQQRFLASWRAAEAARS